MTTRQPRSVWPTALFIGLFGLVWSLRATWLYAIDLAIPVEGWRAVYANLLKFLLWVVPAWGFTAWVGREAPARNLGLTTWPAPRQWGVALVVTGVFLAAVSGFEIVRGQKAFSAGALAGLLTVPGMLSLLVSPWLEEVLFRGLVLPELAAFLPRWAANLLTSLLFAGIHLPFWLTHGGWSPAVLANTIGVFVFSLVAGQLYLLSASIWPPTLAHVANNLVAALLVVVRR